MSIRLVTAVIAVLLTCLLNRAQARDTTCTPDQVNEVTSLTSLPPELAELIGVNRKGTTGIANRDEEFNRFDVIVKDLPMRRFAIGAVGRTCALIAVERGGRGYSVEVEEFWRYEDGWRQVNHSSISTIPMSARELTAYAKR